MKVAEWACDWLLTLLSLFCDDWVFTGTLVCKLLQDYITPCGFPVTPVTGQAVVMRAGPACQRRWPTINHFDSGCLSETACIYTELKQVCV